MWQRAVIACLLFVETHTFAPAPIHWAGHPTRRISLISSALPNGAPVFSTASASSHTLTIRDLPGRLPSSKISHLTANPDKTIGWDGSCLQVGRNAIVVSRCTGEPSQLWNVLPQGRGQNIQIQLRNTNSCLAAVSESALTGIVVELHDCDNRATKLWRFERATAGESSPLSTRVPSQRSPLAPFVHHAMMPSIVLALLSAFTSIAWKWRRQNTRKAATAQVGVQLSVDQGGLYLTAPVAVRQAIPNSHESVQCTVLAAMALEPMPADDRGRHTPLEKGPDGKPQEANDAAARIDVDDVKRDDMHIRIALTREDGQNNKLRLALADAFKELPDGAVDLVEIPCIQHRPGPGLPALVDLFNNLIDSSTAPPFDAAVLTSPQAARVFLGAWRGACGDVDKILPVPLACVGKGTTNEVRSHGQTASFEPSVANAETLAAELPETLGRRILYPASGKAAGTLQKGLAERGFSVERINTYTTEAVDAFDQDTLHMMEQTSIATFGSPSAIRAWAALSPSRPIAACIGDTSLKAAKSAGFVDVYSPRRPGMDGWVESTKEALQTWLGKQNSLSLASFPGLAAMESAEVPTIILQNSKSAKPMPLVGLGLWKSKPHEIDEAIFSALSCGVRLLDSAAVYGNEKEVGAAFARSCERLGVSREEVFVVGKLFNTHHVWDGDTTRVKAACDKSLSDLGVEYLDLYLMHWPYAFLQTDLEAIGGLRLPDGTPNPKLTFQAEFVDTYREMIKLLEAGKCRAIGVCNFSQAQLEELLHKFPDHPPSVNQCELHPYLAQKDLVKFCVDRGITVMAYSPLGSGDSYSGKSFPAKGVEPFENPNGGTTLLENPVVAEIAARVGKTPAQVLIRWNVQRGVVCIPKSVRAARIQENVAVTDWRLSDNYIKMLDALDCGFRYGIGYEPGHYDGPNSPWCRREGMKRPASASV